MPTLIRSPKGDISGLFAPAEGPKPLLVCIHGGGCNGRYFDLKGNSLLEAAAARGFPVLLVDRPGYGGNPAPQTAHPITETAPAIRAFVDQVRGERPVALIGHSIGGAIAVTLASDRGRWPLRAIAISGIGDQSPAYISGLRFPAELTHVPPPPVLTEGLFHDPDRTLKWKAVASLRAAAEDWLVSEVTEVVERWPAEWRDAAARVDVPVHLRLAEHERIWVSGPEVVARMARAFTQAPEVDAALLPGGGHLYEATAGGPAFVRAQLDFIERHASG